MSHQTLSPTVALPEEVYGNYGSKSTIVALEKQGKFPLRHYFDADAPKPRRPFWLRVELDAYVAERTKLSEAARSKASLTGAVTVSFRERAAEAKAA